MQRPYWVALWIPAVLGWGPLWSQDYEQGDPNEENWREPSAHPVEIGIGGSIRRESPQQSEVEETRPLHLHLMWESRYVTEGRDNLDGDALASVFSDISLSNFSFVPWLAHGYESDYSELNLNFVYGLPITDALEIYGGYTHVQARLIDERGHDNEVSLDLVYMPTRLFDLTAGYYYSFEARGGFGELGLQHQQSLHEKVVLSLRGVLGINDGYVIEGHNGWNHVQLRAGVAFYPLKRLEIQTYAAYNIAIESNPEQYRDDLTLRDFFWGGIGIAYHFE